MEEIDNNDRFAAAFDELPPVNPPCGFDRKVMARIDERAKRKSLRIQWFHMLAMPSLGVGIIIGILYLLTKVTEFDMLISIPRINFDPESMNLYIVPAICAIMLLIADTLIRKKIDEKHRSDS